jgi:hypothetical protein
MPETGAKKTRPVTLVGVFSYPYYRLVRNATGAINRGNTHALADAEHFVFLNLLHVGTHAAVVFTHGDLHALGAGQAFFGSRAQQPAGHCADDRCDDTASAAADGTAANSADHCTRSAADRGLGTFDFHRPQGFVRS